MADDILDQISTQHKKYVSLKILAVLRMLLIIFGILFNIAKFIYLINNFHAESVEFIIVYITQVVLLIPFIYYNYVRIKSELKGFSNHPKIWPSFIVIFLCFLLYLGYSLVSVSGIVFMPSIALIIFAVLTVALLVVIIGEFKYLHLHYRSRKE